MNQTNVMHLPQEIEAEQALLGALMISNRAYEKVAEFLKPEHFSINLHGRIFETIFRIIDDNKTANAISVKNYFEDDPEALALGGATFFARLCSSVISVLNAEDYGRTIYDRWKRRELMALGRELIDEASRIVMGTGADDILNMTETRLYDLAEHGHKSEGPLPISVGIAEALAQAEAAFKAGGKTSGVLTGLTDLDELLGGLMPSDLVILGGRPSMGKSALAMSIAKSAAEKLLAQGKKEKVLIFSLEMSSYQLACRQIADVTGVETNRQQTGKFSVGEFSSMQNAGQQIGQLPIEIDCSSAISSTLIRQRARRVKRKHGLSLIVIDYLQLMRELGRTENKRLEIGAITAALKGLAKELSVPILLLSQLSRALESREDKTPQMQDLRESGDIEQDADTILFVYRESYYLERNEPIQGSFKDDKKFNDAVDKWHQAKERAANRADIIVAKQRRGPIGRIGVYFDEKKVAFSNLARDNVRGFHQVD